MTTHLVQVLGAAGIVETIVEFSYALVNLEEFTSFERVFFLVSGSAEMAGEVTVLWWMTKRMLKKDNVADACKVAKDYVRDPMHIWCFSPWWEEEGYDFDLEDGAVRALALSLLPSLFWWVILSIMVFGSGFESDGDGDVMLVLFAASLGFFLSFVVCLLLVLLVYPNGYPFYSCLYSMQKIFEIYLLLSRRERLASDVLGVLLICFQLLELVSCALVVGKFITVKYCEIKRRIVHPIWDEAGVPQC